MTANMHDEAAVLGSAPPGTSGAKAAVRLSALHKSFGPVTAVAGVDLEIAEGEFFTMLGPSGSGKTTTLRMIAGFERPSEGRRSAGRTIGVVVVVTT